MQELSDRLKVLPKLPGVYIMKDAEGVVLYVGKAKNLKSRVRSYFAGGDGRYSVQFLVAQVVQIDTIVTEDERQALVLESDLIKKHQPHYNVRLKDDKAYLVVRIDMNSPWPRLEVVRQTKEDGALYLGPYAFGYEVRTMLEIINRTLPLRTCSDKVLHNRVRPCLEYQIKRCAGPCCLDVERQDYMEWVREAVLILEGKSAEVVEKLRKAMERASAELRFEDAAKYRDSIGVLEQVAADNATYAVLPGSRDAIGLYREGEKAEISTMVIRRGRITDSRTYGFSDLSIDDKELLASFFSQYYCDASRIPDEIVLPFKLEDDDVREEMLSELKGNAVKLVCPKKGQKQRLMQLAAENARENFRARFKEGARDGVLSTVQAALRLEEAPRCIECVDISHFQGGQTVASVVHFKDCKPDKNRYRVFHLSIQGKPDDFASMHEIITRHLSRCAEENTLCDLLIVDGGKEQLAQGLKVRKELGLNRPEMVGLAKKRTISAPYLFSGNTSQRLRQKPERVFIEGEELPIVLRPHSAELHLFERIRDEAHRFAITFHRQTRSKRLFHSVLDDIPGLGPKRRTELLRAFGSLKAIKAASADELVARGKLPQVLAERIQRRLSPEEQTQDLKTD